MRLAHTIDGKSVTCGTNNAMSHVQNNALLQRHPIRSKSAITTRIKAHSEVTLVIALQLLTWHKRRQEQMLVKPRIYRIAPQSPAAPSHLVPKLLSSDNSILGSPQPGTNFGLDPRGAFVIHCQHHLYVWQVCSPPDLRSCFCVKCIKSTWQGHHIQDTNAV